IALSFIENSEDAGLLYWTGAALAKWISFAKGNPVLLIRLPEIKLFMTRALELDSNFDLGAIHEVLVTYEAQVSKDTTQALKHYQQALEASKGQRASVYLTYAESFSLPRENKTEFLSYLQKVKGFDIDAYPEQRLTNAITMQRAEYLLSKLDELFIEE
ncbi:MAG: hypothetical protein HQK83_20095, partial [Fibrobacteria bacterium]|nr:hypothetical protein [Fibrobacteria bacterium]